VLDAIRRGERTSSIGRNALTLVAARLAHLAHLAHVPSQARTKQTASRRPKPSGKEVDENDSDDVAEEEIGHDNVEEEGAGGNGSAEEGTGDGRDDKAGERAQN
jgi:hypothetical protein